MQIIDVKNDQDIILRGCLYDVKTRNTCVLFIPGMAGNIIENKFIQVLGEGLKKKRIGFVCGHNQGSFHIVDYPYTNKDSQPRRGVAYEKFDDCVSDISAYIDYIVQLGYKNIILAGHSLGANKVIYYLSKHKPECIKGYILLGAPDMAYEISMIEDKDKLLAEAKQNIKNGEPDRLLTKLVWDYYVLSSTRFVDLIENENQFNLPIHSKVGSFEALKSIRLPLLVTAGEFDDSCSKDIPNHLASIVKASNYTGETKIIKGCGHTYRNKEYNLFKAVYEFILKYNLK